ncbi:MAG: Gx transporter family protein [Salinispira sp.]
MKGHSGLSDAVLEKIALFAAFSMFCATLEYLFPRPVPFFRLGLANLPIILALPLMNFRQLALLTLMKTLGQALVNGTLASYVFLFSFTGSFASFFLMYLLYRSKKASYIGISLAGALASNTVQGLFSVGFIFGAQSWVILPLFYGLGFAAGLIIAVLADNISRHSRWFHEQYRTQGIARAHAASIPQPPDARPPAEPPPPDDPPPPAEPPAGNAAMRRGRISRHKHERGRRSPLHAPPLQKYLSTSGAFIAGIISLPIFLSVGHPLPRFVQVLILGVLARAAGKRLLYAYFGFLILTVSIFHLFIPQGRVLLSIGNIVITKGALFAGLYRGLSVIGFVFISLFSIRKNLRLPGTIGLLITASLNYFELIYDHRRSANRQNLIGSLDRVLSILSEHSPQTDTEKLTLRLRDIPVIVLIAGALLLPGFIFSLLAS